MAVVLGEKLLEGCPALSAPTDILPLVLAHRAARGRIDRGGELNAAGGADVRTRLGHDHEIYAPRLSVTHAACHPLPFKTSWRKRRDSHPSAKAGTTHHHGDCGRTGGRAGGIRRSA